MLTLVPKQGCVCVCMQTPLAQAQGQDQLPLQGEGLIPQNISGSARSVKCCPQTTDLPHLGETSLAAHQDCRQVSTSLQGI